MKKNYNHEIREKICKRCDMDIIKNIIEDIKYLEKLGLESDEIFESISRDYADINNKDILIAFIKCGYIIKL